MTELPLGSIQANLGDATPTIPFVAKMFGRSTITSILRERPGAQIVHLRIAPEEEFRWGWDTFTACGFTRGQIIDLVDREIGSLCATFLPEVKPSLVGLRYELNNYFAGDNDNAVLYVLIGHKDLFSTHGVVRACTDSVLRPNLLMQRAIEEAAHELSEKLQLYWGPLKKGIVDKVLRHTP